MSTSSVNNPTYNYNQLNPSSNSSNSNANTDTTVAGLTANFLKLLTTQLQNQDPLNPIDNAQMTSQLAQLNMVQGINTLNSTMQTMLTNASNDQYLQAGLLVGHSVLISGNELDLTTPSASSGATRGVAYGVNLASAADSVTATIKDSKGNVVRTYSLGKMAAGTTSLAWDGNKDDGTKAADGTYTVSFTATQGGNDVKATSLQIAGVIGALKSSNGIQLDLGSNGKVGLSDVYQII